MITQANTIKTICGAFFICIWITGILKTVDSCLNSYCEKKEEVNCQLLNQISLGA
jgi:hypothetical protein